MAHYLIIGGDTKEYGPVTDGDVRQWVAEGRLSAQSLVKGEGDTAWRTLASFPEFSNLFTGTEPWHGSSKPSGWPSDFLEHDYELDIGDCFSRGWELVKNNMGLLLVAPLLYFFIQIGIALLAKIPFIGPLFSLANSVAAGAFMGGLFYLFLRVLRQEPAVLGDMFAGFRRSFLQLFLGTLVQALVLGLCLLPFLIFFIIRLIPLVKGLNPQAMSQQESLNLVKSVFSDAFVPSLVWLLICAIPATYLSVSWKFTLPLIIDRQCNFWTAMKASWKMVNRHWWLVLGLVVLIDLLNLAGLCTCCVGMLFTVPIGLAALMIAYETIFAARKN